jgi:hypothetical protein
MFITEVKQGLIRDGVIKRGIFACGLLLFTGLLALVSIKYFNR